jgi:hypothetical protein
VHTRMFACGRTDPPIHCPKSNERHEPTEGITTMPLPKSYRSIEEFEREELRTNNKAGFSLDDLMQETMLHQSDLLFDDQVDELEPDDED